MKDTLLIVLGFVLLTGIVTFSLWHDRKKECEFYNKYYNTTFTTDDCFYCHRQVMEIILTK